jgi:hypothetical protein
MYSWPLLVAALIQDVALAIIISGIAETRRRSSPGWFLFSLACPVAAIVGVFGLPALEPEPRRSGPTTLRHQKADDLLGGNVPLPGTPIAFRFAIALALVAVVLILLFAIATMFGTR